MLSSKKLPLQILLKILQYALIGRAAEIFVGGGVGEEGRASLEDVLSILVWCLLVMIVVKDAIVFGLWVRERVMECRRKKIEGKREVMLKKYLVERAEKQKKA